MEQSSEFLKPSGRGAITSCANAGKVERRIVQIGMHGLNRAAGGVDRYVDGLARGLFDLGQLGRVGVFSGIEAQTDENLRNLGSSDMPLMKRWKAIRRFMQGELGDEEGVVASHFALYALPVVVPPGRAVHVAHFHGPWALESRNEGQGRIAVWLKRQVELRVYRRAARCIVLSKAFADILRNDYGVSPDRIRIVPGGVDTAQFTPRLGRQEARKNLGWRVTGPIVFCVRRLARRMGIDVLLEAFVEVRKQHPTARLMIGGKGAIAEELAEWGAALGLGDAVTWLGFVREEDLPLCFEAADLSVVPSQSLEGFGLVAVESLACGTPVLVTPVGGMPEVVTGLDPRLVLTGSTSSAIAAGLCSALAAPEQLPSSTVCREYAERNFAWSHIARRVLTVYQEAAGQFAR